MATKKKPKIKVRPQDDFFHHTNGEWIKKNPIPDDQSRWGVFDVLREKTEKQLHTLLKEIIKKKNSARNTPEQQVRDFYTSGIDTTLRNKLGIQPIRELLKKIDTIKDTEELIEVCAFFERIGITTPFSSSVEEDLKKSSMNTLYLGQDGLGMPDRDYYIHTDKKTEKIKNHYRKLIQTLFTLVGYSTKESKEKAERVLLLETTLAVASMTRVEQRDPHKIYNKRTRASLKKEFPNIPWDGYFKTLGSPNIRSLILEQPHFLKKVHTILKKTPLHDWKTYLEWHLLNDTAGYLSKDFVDARFLFYGTILSGNKKMRPLWRRILGVVDGTIGQTLGKVYVKRYFSKEAKIKMNALIDDLYAVYEERIKALDWMGSKTKKKALLKLHTMTRKVGYPDKWRSYKALRIEKNDYFGNVIRSHEFEHKRIMKKLGKPVDRSEWYMDPQEVNAYYNPLSNEIVFPAGILQKPFFQLGADDAKNYGGIGEVIGHEMTHGFDDQGSKFDEKGNLKGWWTKEDKIKFEKKAKILEKQFNSFSVAKGVFVNGKLTLGENIADLGGLLIAYGAYQKRLKKTGRKNIQGKTPEQRLFYATAGNWGGHARKEYLSVMVKVDPHSPQQFRVNGPVSNIDEFYSAFDVKKGDALYRPPSKRAKIW